MPRSSQEGNAGEITEQTDRIYFEEHWMRKPGINADIATTNAAATTAITNPDFEILGTNANTADVTFDASGGIKCETDGTSLDSIIILPHLDTTQTAWSSVGWSTEKKIGWGCIIETGSSILCDIWAGLKLTNTPVTATDANQCFFRYSNATVSGRWQFVSSNANTDTSTDSGITVAASTQYKLEIKINDSREPRFYVNDRGYGLNPKLAASITTLIPYVGVRQFSTVAKNIIVRKQWISQDIS
jgi:hypothetical protein